MLSWPSCHSLLKQFNYLLTKADCVQSHLIIPFRRPSLDHHRVGDVDVDVEKDDGNNDEGSGAAIDDDVDNDDDVLGLFCDVSLFSARVKRFLWLAQKFKISCSTLG